MTFRAAEAKGTGQDTGRRQVCYMLPTVTHISFYGHSSPNNQLRCGVASQHEQWRRSGIWTGQRAHGQGGTAGWEISSRIDQDRTSGQGLLMMIGDGADGDRGEKR